MTDKTANKMWGGRFSHVARRDHGGDKRLHRLRQGVWPRRTSAAPRRTPPCWPTQGIIAKDDARTIIKPASTRSLAEIEGGKFAFSRALEDVHMNVESRLKELIGEPAGRLHTARSRNDQVATDFRLYVRDRIDAARCRRLPALQLALARKAEAHAATVMPGFTHLQPAQPVTFGHHLLAYVEMLGRDRGRFADARARLNECPLGAAALAGTSFPIDRHATAEGAGLRPADRQLARRRLRPRLRAGDAGRRRDLRRAPVALRRGDRDLDRRRSSASSGCRDKFTTGSSIMPQKRNPDAAELVRAKVGRIAGAFQSAADGHEGPAARLFQGHAGGQGGRPSTPSPACAWPSPP